MATAGLQETDSAPSKLLSASPHPHITSTSSCLGTCNLPHGATLVSQILGGQWGPRLLFFCHWTLMGNLSMDFPDGGPSSYGSKEAN